MAPQLDRQQHLIRREAQLISLAMANPSLTMHVKTDQSHWRKYWNLWMALRDAAVSGKPTDHDTIMSASQVPAIEMADLITMASQTGALDCYAQRYADEMRDAWQRQCIIDNVGRVLIGGTNTPPAELASRVLSALPDDGDGIGSMAIGDVCRLWLDEYEAAYDDPRGAGRRCVPTGFESVDQMINGGLSLGKLHVVAGNSNSGKSSLVNAIIRNVASGGINVHLYSLEDDRSSILARLVASRGKVTNSAMQSMSADPREAVAELRSVAGWSLSICDAHPTSLAEYGWEMRRSARASGTKLIVLDYIQILPWLRGVPGESLYDKTNSVIAELLSVACDTGAAMLAVSQYSRQGELLGSGQIYHRAYTVLELTNRHRVDPRDPEWPDGNPKVIPVIEIGVTKNKNGPKGTVLMRFDSRHATFAEADHRLAVQYRTGKQVGQYERGKYGQ
jgi:replicative DNA helicase